MDLNKNVKYELIEALTIEFRDFYPIILEMVEFNSIDSINKITNRTESTINDSIDNYYNPDNLF